MMQLEIDNTILHDTAVEEMGKTFVSSELGGGGSAKARSIAIAKKGLRNFLIHVRILQGPLQLEPSIEIHMPDENCFTFATCEDLFEPSAQIGGKVNAALLNRQVISRAMPEGDILGFAPPFCINKAAEN